MTKLIKYVQQHTVRGACQCGQCIDAPADPKSHQPNGHTADLVFFQVAKRGEPDPVEFVRLIEENQCGAFGDVNPLDGKEHNYMELGGWIGDQGLAMQFMGLGSLLGTFRLFTPRTLGLPEGMVMQMAGSGFLSIQRVDAK